MDAVVLRTADGDQDNVVLLALLNDHFPGAGLDVAAGLAHFGVGGDAVVVQNVLNLGFGCVPEPFFELTDFGVLKDDIRVIRGQIAFFHCGPPYKNTRRPRGD